MHGGAFESLGTAARGSALRAEATAAAGAANPPARTGSGGIASLRFVSKCLPRRTERATGFDRVSAATILSAK